MRAWAVGRREATRGGAGRLNKALQVWTRDLNCGIVKEPAGEQRVALVPAVATALGKKGYVFHVEKGAGAGAGIPDSAYADAGCVMLDRQEVINKGEIFFSVRPPPEAELPKFSGKTVVGWVGRLLPKGKEYVAEANKSKVQLIDTTAVPRITIAQKLDVLSSQAKLAGHRAVIEAAYAYQKFHAPEITAAGKYPPSHSMILGCGVAGLAAMGTSKALGSVVRAWDVRDVSDQVQSMGASWIKVDFEEDASGAGGYAKESSKEFLEAQRATFHKHCKECDIVITTAAIPGRPSPKLVEDYMVKDMKPGSVIVDLAAEGGGNCTMTKAGEKYTTDNGVTIIGYTDNPGRMAMQASSMYSQNMANLVDHITGKEGGDALLGLIAENLGKGEEGDIVTRSIVCCKEGSLVEMPPPPQPTPPKPKQAPVVKQVVVQDPFDIARRQAGISTIASVGLMGLGAGCIGDVAMTANVGTFALAGSAGYQAVWGVAHALHTPLMSVTNAISGTTAIGGMMLMGHGGTVEVLAASAVGISTINIVGGFVVSKRMLDLFQRPGDVDYSYLQAVPGGLLVVAPFLNPGLIPSAGVASSMLCIGSLVSLANMKSALRGCYMGMSGVAGGMAATIAGMPGSEILPAAQMMVGGSLVGAVIGKQVSPIALPQTVAAFHSLVGLAAMITSIGSGMLHPDADKMHRAAAIFGDWIGGITLTGSLVAFGKLNGNLASAPMNLPGKNMINLGSLAATLTLFGAYIGGGGVQLPNLLASAALSNAMGYHIIGSVGGADMPVCITVLNAYSGMALVAEGFLLHSPVLTIIGSLITFSGSILTIIMCDAMNRDLANVIFGGMNTAPKKAVDGDEPPKIHVETTAEAVATSLTSAKSVLIVPGYGMAVARAQGAVAEVATTLRNAGVSVRFGIHPVAGRMPGQMNVLLAEAGVPYDWVLEMDEVNPDMEETDVALVIGANDITNSAAIETEGCPIYGMPVLEVWNAKQTVFMKRSMAAGYADLDNPVFYKENTQMFLGDAKERCDELAMKIKEQLA